MQIFIHMQKQISGLKNGKEPEAENVFMTEVTKVFLILLVALSINMQAFLSLGTNKVCNKNVTGYFVFFAG